MNSLIRAASLDDYGQVKVLFQQVAQLHIDNRKDIYQNGLALNKRTFEMIIDDEDIISLVICLDNEVVGVSILSLKLPEAIAIHKERQIGFIDTFCIRKENKNQGLGQLLFDKTIEIAKQLDVETIELQVWSFNQDAIIFYEKMGLTNQSIIMELNI